MKNCKYYEDGLCNLKITHLRNDGSVKYKCFDVCILDKINKSIKHFLSDERLNFQFKCVEWEEKK